MLQRRPPPAGAAEARRWRRPEGGAGAWRHPAGCSAQRAATSPRPPGCWSGGCGCPRACVAGARGRRPPPAGCWSAAAAAAAAGSRGNGQIGATVSASSSRASVCTQGPQWQRRGCVFVKGGGSERDARRHRKEPRHGAGCIAKARERASSGVVQRKISWGTVGPILAER